MSYRKHYDIRAIDNLHKSGKLEKSIILSNNVNGDTLFSDMCNEGYLTHIMLFVNICEKDKIFKKDILIRNKYDLNALDRAIINGHVNVVKYLIEQFTISKEDIVVKNKYEYTALQMAIMNNHLNVVYTLLTHYGSEIVHKSDFIIKNALGQSLLYQISYDGRFDILTWLMTNCSKVFCLQKTDVMAINQHKNLSPLFVAILHKHEKIVELFIDICDIQREDVLNDKCDFKSIFIKAIKLNNVSVVELLIRKFNLQKTDLSISEYNQLCNQIQLTYEFEEYNMIKLLIEKFNLQKTDVIENNSFEIFFNGVLMQLYIDNMLRDIMLCVE